MSEEQRIRNQVAKRQAHAKACKKPLDQCKTCQDNIKWFSTLPADTLSKVLS